MQKRIYALSAWTAVMVALAGVGMLLTTGNARATVIGTLLIDPAAGTDTSQVTLTTPAACTGGTYLQGTIAGPGFASPVNVTPNAQQITLPTSAAGGYIVTVGNTLQFYGNSQTPPVVFAGTYTFTVTCKSQFPGATFGDFVGSVNFTDPHTFVATTNPGSGSSSGSSSSAASSSSAGSSSSAASSSSPAANTSSGSATTTPTPTTTAAAGSLTATDSSGAALPLSPTLAPGASVTLTAGGFSPSETVQATLHSVPQALRASTATAGGSVTYSFVVPTGLAAGSHTVVLAGAVHSASFAFVIAGPPGTDAASSPTGSLPRTGGSAFLPLVVWGVALFGGGVWAIVWARRQGLLRFDSWD